MAGIPAQFIAIGNRLIHGLPFKVIAEGFLSGTKAGDLVTKEQLDAATFPFTGDATMTKESATSKSVASAYVINRVDLDGNNTSAALDGMFRVDTDTENERYRVTVEGVDDDTAQLLLQKTNNAGEQVTQDIDYASTGFVTSNDLADDTASIHRFQNNNVDSILDLLNDNLQSDVLLDNNFADDTAAAAGDVPVGGLYHNAGALRIRLAS